MDFKELREAVYEANMELFGRGLVIYTFGNVSQIDRSKGVVGIKPSGVSYEKLSPKDIVIVGLDNTVISGHLRPSSDTKTHTHLYRVWPEVGGITHTHSTYATAWAQAQQPIPCYGTTHADYVHGEIPCTEILSDQQAGDDYEEETGVQIETRFAELDRLESPMTLVAGHGPFTWGCNASEAVYHSVILEELARMAYITRQLNSESRELPKAIMDKHYDRKHGVNSYYGQ